MMRQYILKDKKPVPVDDIMEWGRFFNATESRRVARTEIGGFLVSTVFLGLDHRLSMDEGEPILFETMVFSKDDFNEYTERYCSWEEAEEGHKKAVALVESRMVVDGLISTILEKPDE